MELEAGSIVGLIGQSGGGKSTIARILAGLSAADAGKVFYLNKEIGRTRKRSSRICGDIQYIFQDPYNALEGTATVKQVLDETLELCGRQKRTDIFSPEEVIGMVGLDYEYWQAKRVSVLSGGQKQKLCLARAILPKPRLVIADESTAMLNNESAMEIYRLLGKIRNELGTTVFLITHQIPVIKEICDFLYVLREGEIVEAGERNEVLSAPKSGYTKRLLECIDYLGGTQLG
jgi:ABC-type glutathione transport system ATPase component